jgi:hypothetical protein
MDVTGAKETAEQFRSTLVGKAVMSISAVTGTGVKQLLARMVQMIDQEAT